MAEGWTRDKAHAVSARSAIKRHTKRLIERMRKEGVSDGEIKIALLSIDSRADYAAIGPHTAACYTRIVDRLLPTKKPEKPLPEPEPTLAI